MIGVINLISAVMVIVSSAYETNYKGLLLYTNYFFAGLVNLPRALMFIYCWVKRQDEASRHVQVNTWILTFPLEIILDICYLMGIIMIADVWTTLYLIQHITSTISSFVIDIYFFTIICSYSNNPQHYRFDSEEKTAEDILTDCYTDE